MTAAFIFGASKAIRFVSAGYYYGGGYAPIYAVFA